MYFKLSDCGNHRVPKARKGGEHERVIIPPNRKGVSTEAFFFNFERFMFVLMGFNVFGTRLQWL